MKKISLDQLAKGSRLGQDLFSNYGVKLVPRGTCLSEALLQRLKRVGHHFFLANDVRRLAEEHRIREVDPAIIRPGMDAPKGMLSLGGRLLDESAERVEPHHIDSIEFGLFQQLEPEPSTIAAQRRAVADEVVKQHAELWDSIDQEILNVGEDLEFDSIDPTSWPNHHQLIAWRDERVDRIRAQYARMLAGLPAELNVFELIVDELIGLLRTDPSRFAQVGLLCPQRCDYLPDHALSTSVLAMLLGAREGYSSRGIQILGLTGLLHDVGMLLVPQRIRTTSERDLSEVDRNRILNHPSFSVALLDEITDLPEVVRWAAYRHHERDDGKGYPCGLPRARIGEMPRLMAVSDVAAAMLGNRPFRDDKLPHEALHELAQLGRSGALNRSMIRYLIESVGLYPIGSYVRLSTGEGALVVANHAGSADRPVVRICDHAGQATRREIDLTVVDPWVVSILQGIPSEQAAKRIYIDSDDTHGSSAVA